jgi:hypothetical protein
LGEVVQVKNDAARMLETNFWRVDVVVLRSEVMGTLTIPIHVSENLLEGEWRPRVGEHVTGNAWLQAYPKAVL